MPISQNLKIAQILCASIWCLFAAGIVFGFAAFKVVLLNEGVYSELCHSDQSAQSAKPCVKQDLKLNLLFTVAAGVTNVIALPVGWILDNYGPRVCGIIGSVWIASASLIFVWSRELEAYCDPYLLGYTALAVGGPFVFISCFQLANSFPKKSGSILALITGTFDSSSALFLLYRLTYQKHDNHPHLPSFFKLYLAVPIFIIVCQLTIMPRDSYRTQADVVKLTTEGLDENGQLLEGDDGSAIIPDVHERESLLSQEATEYNETIEGQSGRRKSVLENYMENKLERKSGGAFGILHGLSLNDQLRSPLFYLMVIFATVCMLRINYFVATIRSQEEYLLGDPKLAAKMNTIFDVALPLGGLVSIPFTGLILDSLDTLSTLSLVSLTSIAIGILGLIPNSFTANLLGILLLVVYRPFYYTVISDYVSKIFGFETFGTVYGALISISGAFNMLQSVLDKWTHNNFDMNPFPVNSVLLLATIVSSFFLVRDVQVSVRRRKAKELAEPVHASPVATYGST